MEIFRQVPSIDFLRHRKAAAALSGVLLLVAIVSLAFQQLEFGIDFTGGTLVEVGYATATPVESVRAPLAAAGFGDAQVQHFGTARDVLIRIPPHEDLTRAELSDQAFRVLESASDEEVTLRRVEFVGPQVGEELTEQGGLAMLIALGAILLYVSVRFEYRFALGAVAALVHDVIVVLGFFSVTRMEFDLTVLAAVLAVIGYSLNDTIVVFDRVRENFRKMRKGTPLEVMNRSLNQTLARTLMTSLTTLLVVLALFFLGGELIHGFAAALLVGVIIGTYSTIFVGAPIALALGVSKADLMPVKKEGAEVDASP
jgi:preprotein translocase subunit SecF